MWNIAGTGGANACYPFASKEPHEMDSLPTGSTHSLLIVVAVAFSPVIVLSLADAIGWLIRQARGKGGVATLGQDASGVRQ
jgi:hypothetical protein